MTSIASLLVALILVLAPALALAHAALEDSTPVDGETVTGTPPIISATYSEDLDHDGSSLVLVDTDGKEIARGGTAGSGETREMTIEAIPDLEPGEYTVESTTKSADDGDIDRTKWSFTVIAAPSQTPGPTPVCTDECAGQPSGGETIAPSPTAPSAPSASVSGAPATGASSGEPTPLPSATPGDDASSSSDALLPIVAGLAIVAIAAVVLVRRRGRSSTGT